MKSWSVRSRIIAAFAVVLLIVAGLSAFIFNRLEAIRKQAWDITADSLPGLLSMGELDSRIRANHVLALQRLVAAPADKERYDEQIQSNNKRIDELLKLYEAVVFEPQDRQLFDALKRQLSIYNSAAQALRDAETRNVTDVGVLRRQLDMAQATLIGDVTAEMDYNRLAVHRDATEVIDEEQSSKTAIIVALLFGTLAAGLTAFLVLHAINGLIGDIQKTGIQVNTSATEIAATAREHQATANEIAATTSEIGATSREISATSKELSRTMTDVTSVAEKTAILATSGQGALVRMEETIHQISEAAGSISAKLSVLNEKAANIGSVVTTINKVADQTNLLSLNAAIEAEKAGEYGRGFAVVATEIRRLADQTAISTHDIEQMVKQMQSAVSAGVMGMEKFSDEVRRAVVVVGQVSGELSQIIEEVQTLTPSFENVNEGMQAQSVAAEQISDALAQLSDAAQQTVDSLGQSNIAIEQLNAITRNLQRGVARFTGTA
jgi:methyl-accepting chemotaxis protein WspA